MKTRTKRTSKVARKVSKTTKTKARTGSRRVREAAAAPAAEVPVAPVLPSQDRLAALRPGALLFSELEVLLKREELAQQGLTDSYSHQAALDMRSHVDVLTSAAMKSKLGEYEALLIRSLPTLLEHVGQLHADGLVRGNPRTATLAYLSGFFRLMSRALAEVVLTELRVLPGEQPENPAVFDPEVSARAMARLEVFLRASLRSHSVLAYEVKVRRALDPQANEELMKHSATMQAMMAQPGAKA